MDCEICGKTIEKTTTILIDGTQFDVCDNCVSLGKKIELADEPVFEKRKPEKSSQSFSPSRSQNYSSSPNLVAATLTEGFGKKIMQARQRKNLTLKEQALKIYEKESVVQRIEAEKFKPSDKMIIKLQRELEVKLTE